MLVTIKNKFFSKYISEKTRDKKPEELNNINEAFANDYQYSRAVDELKYLSTKNK